MGVPGFLVDVLGSMSQQALISLTIYPVAEVRIHEIGERVPKGYKYIFRPFGLPNIMGSSATISIQESKLVSLE